jgi:hypothetical protein
MIINKKTYKILNIFIVAIFLFVLIIYSTFFNNLANQTDRYNKSYYVQKSIDGYLLEVEGLFFKEREKKIDSQSYFRGASNPMTAFKYLEKDVWLDFILVSIQNNYNQNGKCFFKPSVSRNVINIYKINSGSQEEISPSIDIKLNYTSNQKTQIDECLAFINNLISKVNAKVEKLINNEINGYTYSKHIRTLNFEKIGDDKIISKEYLISVAEALIQNEIETKKKLYKGIKVFELKERPKDFKKTKSNKYIPYIILAFITIFFLILLNIIYRLRLNFGTIFK